MIKNKKQVFIVTGAFILTLLLGTVTYAFFNYTRTGTANVIRTGQINFTTTQSSGQNGAISLSNVFPVDVSEGVPSNDSNVGDVIINITGNTEYTGGIEYLVSAVNVTNTVGSKVIPIGINVTATSGLGTSDENYYTDRRNSPETSIYKLLAGDTIDSNADLLVGYIKSGQTGVNGNIVIKAYLDDSKIAISDTYYENVTTAPAPTAPTDEYGTPASFGEGRVVLTTTEWNSLQSSGVSFQVKVEAKEGIWVEEPVFPTPPLASCPGEGCKYIYTEIADEYYYSANNFNSSPISTLTTFANNNETLVDDYTLLNKNLFLGFVFDGNENVAKAYVCGIKGEEPNNGTLFCIEGRVDGSIFTENSTFLNDSTTGLWEGECDGDGTYTYCEGSVSPSANNYGTVNIEDSESSCMVSSNGYAYCSSW